MHMTWLRGGMYGGKPRRLASSSFRPRSQRWCTHERMAWLTFGDSSRSWCVQEFVMVAGREGRESKAQWPRCLRRVSLVSE